MSELKSPFIVATQSEVRKAEQNLSNPTIPDEYRNTNAQPRAKSPEEKRYVILLVALDSSDKDVDHVWLDAIGRTAAYQMAKGIAMEKVADLTLSTVLVEGVNLEGGVPLVSFLEHISKNVFNDTSFDVRDYIDVEDDTTAEANNVPMGVADTDQVGCLYDPAMEGEDI